MYKYSVSDGEGQGGKGGREDCDEEEKNGTAVVVFFRLVLFRRNPRSLVCVQQQ